MEPTDTIRFHAAPHPSAPVRQAGFSLHHAYLEQCWLPLVGPTATVLLRRVEALWREDLSPVVDAAEFAKSIGLGGADGRQAPLWRSLRRLERFRFVQSAGTAELEVFTEIPPVRDRDLNRLPAWNRGRHEQLLGAHLDRLADLRALPPSPTDIGARLDHMTTRSTRHPSSPSLHR